ncbi:hypothetical protein MUG84_03885 [Paenibacillus sp. KQZ6P-2]|uniref:Uncharacterized protein n=1 Tax=Paenibacillus mangrovi TaxID=2931978 RepID=A0A9X1WN60_9BACL|nr:hypothetical protein [Paenibacillus mangrovi]MCJ8010885.1 hypothetical protein [Paenibacillus mangrovi]
MQIYSPSVETCRPHVGRHVCAVLHDGTRLYGTITGVSENGLELDCAGPRANILSTKAGKDGKQKAKTSAYGYGYRPYGYGYRPYGYGFGAYNALAWTSIALLFLIPFLFI